MNSAAGLVPGRQPGTELIRGRGVAPPGLVLDLLVERSPVPTFLHKGRTGGQRWQEPGGADLDGLVLFGPHDVAADQERRAVRHPVGLRDLGRGGDDADLGQCLPVPGSEVDVVAPPWSVPTAREAVEPAARAADVRTAARSGDQHALDAELVDRPLDGLLSDGVRLGQCRNGRQPLARAPFTGADPLPQRGGDLPVRMLSGAWVDRHGINLAS